MDHALNIVSVVFASAAWILYVQRSGWLVANVPQSIWAKLTRIGVGSVFATLAVAYVDRVVSNEEFITRNWLVLAALIVTVVGHIGLYWGGPKDPT